MQSPSSRSPLTTSAEPVHTSLHAKLIGTVVASIPEWSWALIEDTQAHSNDVYMPKDKIRRPPSSPSRRIGSSSSTMGTGRSSDRTEGTGPVAVAAPPPAPEIHEVNEGKYSIPKSEVDKTLANLNEVAMQARIVPAFKDGVATGFKLFSIRPDSIYSKIGIQNGDVIRRLNGFDINSPDKALEAYSKLKDATTSRSTWTATAASSRRTTTSRRSSPHPAPLGTDLPLMNPSTRSALPGAAQLRDLYSGALALTLRGLVPGGNPTRPDRSTALPAPPPSPMPTTPGLPGGHRTTPAGGAPFGCSSATRRQQRPGQRQPPRLLRARRLRFVDTQPPGPGERSGGGTSAGSNGTAGKAGSVRNRRVEKRSIDRKDVRPISASSSSSTRSKSKNWSSRWPT